MSEQQDLPKTDRIQINANNIEYSINYLKVGNGPKTLFLLPGAIGSIFSDFTRQVQYFDREKYTIVAWDPPGSGYSRPPDKDVSQRMYYRDAECAISFMKALRIEKYTLLGFCGGGMTALIMASKDVDRVEKIVVWGARSYFTEDDIKFYEKLRDIDRWPKDILQRNVAMYGKEYLTKIWIGLSDTYKFMFDTNNFDICREALPLINAPTMILHGIQDRLIFKEQPVYMQENIKTALPVVFFDDGGHNIHETHADQFHAKVENFINSE